MYIYFIENLISLNKPFIYSMIICYYLGVLTIEEKYLFFLINSVFNFSIIINELYTDSMLF